MFKNRKKRLTLLLVSLSLILVAGIGVTVALIIDNTDEVENVFTPSRVACAVVEDGVAYENNTANVSSKSDVTIKNTGDTAAYIRAAIIINWKNADGTVWAQTPVEDTDYEMQLGTGWTYSGGYYYYNSSVLPGDSTAALITGATQKKDAPKDGYYLSVEIVASAIQSSLAGSALDAWAAAASN